MNQVLKNAKSYLGNDVIILPSTRKNKKFMIMNPENKYVHFGDKDIKTLHKIIKIKIDNKTI